MGKHLSVEIVINVVLETADDRPYAVEVIDWQFDARPPDQFQRLSPVVRAQMWQKLRDEIEEYWISAALESSPDAAWNRRLEDVDLDPLD